MDLSKQLEYGVRALMIDIYEVMGKLLVYHGFPFLGYKPASFFFDEIKTFLDQNPNEVVTIIFETYASERLIEKELRKSGLYEYLYHHNPENSWKKIEEMIAINQRLVVFSDKKPESVNNTWYLFMWDYAFETHFAVHHPDDFDIKHLRGKPENDFYILNHFVTYPKVGLGNRSAAKTTNSALVINERIKESLRYYGRLPNFLVLDFVDIGDGKQTVELLNNFCLWNHKIIPEKESHHKESFLDNRLFLRTKKIMKYWALLF